MGGGRDVSIPDNMCTPVIGTRSNNTQSFAHRRCILLLQKFLENSKQNPVFQLFFASLNIMKWKIQPKKKKKKKKLLRNKPRNVPRSVRRFTASHKVKFYFHISDKKNASLYFTSQDNVLNCSWKRINNFKNQMYFALRHAVTSCK